MHFTEIGLTQYEMHDKFNPLEQYNRDMQIITTTATVASGEIVRVEAKIDEEVTRLNARADMILAKTQENKTEIEAIKAKNTQQDNRLTILEAGIHSLDITTTSISNALIEHIETAVNENAALTEEIKKVNADLSTKIAADEQRIAVNEAAIAQHADRLGALETAGAGNTANISALEGRVGNLERVDGETATTLQQLRDKNVEQDGKIQSNTNEINAFDSRMDAAEQNVEDLSEKVDALDERVGGLIPYKPFNVRVSANGKNYASYVDKNVSPIFVDSNSTEVLTGIAGEKTLVPGKLTITSVDGNIMVNYIITVITGQDNYSVNNGSIIVTQTINRVVSAGNSIDVQLNDSSVRIYYAENYYIKHFVMCFKM